jgi:hypothetical protein
MTCSVWAEAVWSLAVLGRYSGLCTLLQAFDRSLGHDTQVALGDMDARHLLWVAWGQGALVSMREEHESGNGEALDESIMQGMCVYIYIYYVYIYIYIHILCVCVYIGHLLWVAWGQGALVSMREEHESGNGEALDESIMQGMCVCVYIYIYTHTHTRI